jgi:hypothetical protein
MDEDNPRPRDVLAANLVRLMKAHPDLSSFPAITERGGGANGTLDRIRRKESATSIDNLAPLASVFGLEPWQLLVPDLDPAAPPQIIRSTLVAEIRAVLGAADTGAVPKPLDLSPTQKHVSKGRKQAR